MSFELGPNQRKWVEALRSGEFTQGHGRLFDGNGHCCLGVLAELAGCQKSDSYTGGIEFDNESALAPKRAVDLVALRSKFGEPEEGVSMNYKLPKMNDEGQSFPEIADAIEAHPDWYFTESR